jgi:hypothetical protein
VTIVGTEGSFQSAAGLEKPRKLPVRPVPYSTILAYRKVH